MAYKIPPETVEHIRSQTDIVQVISEYLTLKKGGANYKACCPFHTEKTPSFTVSPAKQMFYCFGCGAGGNVFGFLMRQEGFSFAEAVKHLADRLGIEIKESRFVPEQQQVREQLFNLYEFARGFYTRQLLKSADAAHARAYLERRRLLGEAAERFSLGFAPAGWDTFTTEASRKGFNSEVLLQGGLAKKSAEGRVYDAFRNRIMFPILDIWGKAIAFGGRTLEENQPKYINSPETPIYRKGETLYNLHQARKSISNKGCVFVVEGYVDAIRVALSGFENVVASLGTAFTQSQARLLRRYASEVILVFDTDSAGEAAATRGIEVLLQEDLGVRVTTLPSAKDPDEFLLEHGAEAFGRCADESRNFVEFHIDNALAGRSGWDVDTKVKTANVLASLVAKMPDPIKKEEYLRLIAGRVGIQAETLLKASQKTGFVDKIEIEVRNSEKRLKHEERECLWLIKLMAERPECREKIRDNLDMSCIENEALKELLSTSFQLEDNSPLESRLLDAVQTEEAQQFLSHLMFADAAPELLYPVEWWLSIIRNRQNEKKLFALNSKIREAEQTGDLEQQFEIKKIKHEGRIKLEDDKKGVLEIPVFDKDELVNLETTFSGLIEVGLREIEKAKVSGDIKTIKRWEETIKSLKGGNTGRKKWEVPF
jgi:DNA primase